MFFIIGKMLFFGQMKWLRWLDLARRPKFGDPCFMDTSTNAEKTGLAYLRLYNSTQSVLVLQPPGQLSSGQLPPRTTAIWVNLHSGQLPYRKLPPGTTATCNNRHLEQWFSTWSSRPSWRSFAIFQRVSRASDKNNHK